MYAKNDLEEGYLVCELLKSGEVNEVENDFFLLTKAMHHDLGKCGFPGKGREVYQVETSDWHRKNMGRMYKHNENIPFTMVPDLRHRRGDNSARAAVPGRTTTNKKLKAASARERSRRATPTCPTPATRRRSGGTPRPSRTSLFESDSILFHPPRARRRAGRRRRPGRRPGHLAPPPQAS